MSFRLASPRTNIYALPCSSSANWCFNIKYRLLLLFNELIYQSIFSGFRRFIEKNWYYARSYILKTRRGWENQGTFTFQDLLIIKMKCDPANRNTVMSTFSDEEESLKFSFQLVVLLVIRRKARWKYVLLDFKNAGHQKCSSVYYRP